jgi:hypothetical protein
LLLHTSYLPLGVPNGLVIHHAQGRLLHIHSTKQQDFFWRRCRGTKKNNLPRQLGTIKRSNASLLSHGGAAGLDHVVTGVDADDDA